MKIKYTVGFKRILFCNINDKGKIQQMRVGEVELFQQNLDGNLDIVAKIWPQTPASLVKQIEANPGMMGMNSEALPVKGHLVAPDTAQFEAVDDPDALTIEKLLKRIEYLELRFSQDLESRGKIL